ncbi:fasciclin domain-containing protein [Parvularcula maris]|uniref:Fasciclin domain-containing protein n=1 Tax=Parvularcula maris TaxID=2965077 RepID=A0A9X2LAD3_9PROT|nr:fasciclin domain-containing protein [Parvularcula maris]MCQ8186083.1 fasciclin domain-containing protein [Parvularcula maris]
MKFRFALLAAAASLAAAPAASVAADHHGKKKMAKAEETIVGVAAGNDQFSTLVTAVKTAELVDTLNSEGPFTVFAPVNDAFAALPEGAVDALLEEDNRQALTMVLTYHVVSGKVAAKDLTKMIRDGGGEAKVTTVEGSELTARVENGDVILTDVAGNEIKVVKTDVPATNGVIHAIDGVLLPATSPSES